MGSAEIAGLNTNGLDNEGLDIDGPDNDGPIVTKLQRRSCLLCVCRRSRLCYYLLLNSTGSLLDLQLNSPTEIYKQLHMFAEKTKKVRLILC